MDFILHNPYTISFLQIIVAVCLGSLLGIERTFAGKTAGMRTYGLVCMGSCLFIIISEYVTAFYAPTLSVDPLHLAAGVITGIGFIGAGLIIFKDSKLSGLTTAAGLWVSCGIGIAVGYNLIAIAVFATIVTLFSFTVLWSVENKVKEIIHKEEI
jgi:putative Mg2+ transporter-C (MgtC) family protein